MNIGVTVSQVRENTLNELINYLVSPFGFLMELQIVTNPNESSMNTGKLAGWSNSCWGITDYTNCNPVITIRNTTPEEWMPIVILNEVAKKILTLKKYQDNISCSPLPPITTSSLQDWSQGPQHPSYESSLPYRAEAFIWALSRANKLAFFDLKLPSNIFDVAFGEPQRYPAIIQGLGFDYVSTVPLLGVDNQSYFSLFTSLGLLNKRFRRHYRLQLYSHIDALPLAYRGWPSTVETVTVWESDTIYINVSSDNPSLRLLEEFHKKMQRDGLIMQGNPFSFANKMRKLDPTPFAQLGHGYMSPQKIVEYNKIYCTTIELAKLWATRNYEWFIEN